MKISLHPYGESGWEFAVDLTPYRTDTHGDGLWRFKETGAWFEDGEREFAYTQIAGTCQFSLPAKRSSAYSKIRRYFSDPWNEM